MKEDILRQRRNLIGVSVALSLYQLAGGEISKTATFMGFVTVENRALIVNFAWLTLMYFIWRYWVHMAPIRRQVSISVNENKISRGENLFEARIQEELANSLKYRVIAKQLLKQKDENAENSLNERRSPALIRSTFKRVLDFSALYAENKGTGSNQQGPEINIPYMKVFRHELLAQFRAAFKDSTFSDYLLPYYLAVIPFILFFANSLGL